MKRIEEMTVPEFLAYCREVTGGDGAIRTLATNKAGGKISGALVVMIGETAEIGLAALETVFARMESIRGSEILDGPTNSIIH